MHLSVFDRKEEKKKNNLILGVWLFPVDWISSWVALQWPVCVCIYVCVDRVQAALRETVMGHLSAALHCCCKYTKHTAWPSSWPCAPSLWPCPLSISFFLSFCFSCSLFVLITLTQLSVSSLHLLPLKNANQLTFVSSGTYKKQLRFKSEKRI